MRISQLPSPLGLGRASVAGLDPAGFFRRRAGKKTPITLLFPGLGEVVFFGTNDAAHDILTVPSARLGSATSQPDRASRRLRVVDPALR